MSILSHILKQSAKVLVTIYNKYGDQELSSYNSELCRFREINGLDKANNREDIKSDAMLWLEPTSLIAEGDIVKCEGNFYRVQDIIKARKMDGNIQFVKCLLERHSAIEDVS